jgi:hypothetical protein
LSVVPAGKSGHPGADIEDTEQEKKTEPFIGAGFIDLAFTEQEYSIYKPVNKKDQQDGAEGVKTELHAGYAVSVICKTGLTKITAKGYRKIKKGGHTLTDTAPFGFLDLGFFLLSYFFRLRLLLIVKPSDQFLSFRFVVFRAS